jgi:tetratricopeptide (TPR) repeat protein
VGAIHVPLNKWHIPPPHVALLNVLAVPPERGAAVEGETSPSSSGASGAREIFDHALEIESADERTAYLLKACGGNPGLREEVETLLKAHDAAGDFMESPATELDSPILLTPPGTVIGRYKLLEPIGEGGYGTVFMAEQTAPVHRKVALKVVKAGMDTRQVIARFEAERQALALMDHPNIAKVFDAGVTETGRPYFVMELVKGVPITRYCDEHRLIPRDRLELFVQVCQAVQHAHQKGIIHRDLKPSNVLVALYDGKPVPKVIDFGVAKATGQRLTEKTMFTGLADVIGTPQYMSPEQAELNQLDIDTRSDIYSLGVILYELLTGSPPFSRQELEKAGMLEMLRVIREREPTRPSTKLSTAEGLPTLAANRNMEPARLTKLVRGELDWIVMKALEKDRSHRYETANGLAKDVERYLADEPVQACPPSAVYRLRKFARRHKAAMAMGLALVVAGLVAAGAVAASVGWAIRDRAARQAVVEVAVDVALKEAQGLHAQRKYAQALQAAKRAEGLVAGSSDQDLQRRVGNLRKDLEMVLRLESIRLGVADHGEDGFDFAGQDAAYAVAFRDFGIDAELLEPAEAANRVRATTIRIELAAALDDWAFVRGLARKQGNGSRKKLVAVARLADPDEFRNQVRDAQESMDATRVKELAHSEKFNAQWPNVQLLLLALSQTGQSDESLPFLRRAQIEHPDDFWFNHVLGFFLQEKEPLRAIRFFTAARALRPDSSTVANNLAWLLATCPDPALRDPDEAVALATKAVELTRERGSHWRALGVAQYRARHWKAAVEALDQSMRLGHGGNVIDWLFLAMAHWQLGEKDVARNWYARAAEWMAKNQPQNEELRRFRTEAEELLKIAGKGPTSKANSK